MLPSTTRATLCRRCRSVRAARRRQSCGAGARRSRRRSSTPRRPTAAAVASSVTRPSTNLPPQGRGT
eukprot:6963242-Prymnesium_polylepis.1